MEIIRFHILHQDPNKGLGFCGWTPACPSVVPHANTCHMSLGMYSHSLSLFSSSSCSQCPFPVVYRSVTREVRGIIITMVQGREIRQKYIYIMVGECSASCTLGFCHRHTLPCVSSLLFVARIVQCMLGLPMCAPMSKGCAGGSADPARHHGLLRPCTQLYVQCVPIVGQYATGTTV